MCVPLYARFLQADCDLKGVCKGQVGVYVIHMHPKLRIPNCSPRTGKGAAKEQSTEGAQGKHRGAQREHQWSKWTNRALVREQSGGVPYLYILRMPRAEGNT